MTAPRWAIAQPRMHWTLAGNLGETLATLEAAAAAGAAGCVCTELAVTGFHRRLPELIEAAALSDAEAHLRAACGRLGLAAAIGLPTLAADGAVYNSHVYIDAQGREVGRVHKRGLTPSEATFFKAGATRGWTALAGLQVTSVLCREMLDVDALLGDLAGDAGEAGPRVIFWPSYIGESDTEQVALCEAYRDGARELATALGAWVLQSNWPQGFGASVVIAPDGQQVAQLPRDEAALAMVVLG